MELHDLACCGVKELNGISYDNHTPYALLLEFCKDFINNSDDPEFAHVVFTQAGAKARYGINLAAYITRHKLGTIVRSAVAVNPNTSNPLVAFIWTINRPALRKWYVKESK